MTEVYVIHWEWGDKSGSGVVSIGYETKEGAEAMLAVLQEHSDKRFTIYTVQVQI